MNNRSILSKQAYRKITVCSGKDSPLLALTDRQNEGQRNKLILVGLGNLPGYSRLILVGLGSLPGSSRLILVGLGTFQIPPG